MSAKGWGWPGASKKAHYFVEASSLCGGWLFFGVLTSTAVEQHRGPDDCARCHSQLLRMHGLKTVKR